MARSFCARHRVCRILPGLPSGRVADRRQRRSLRGPGAPAGTARLSRKHELPAELTVGVRVQRRLLLLLLLRPRLRVLGRDGGRVSRPTRRTGGARGWGRGGSRSGQAWRRSAADKPRSRCGRRARGGRHTLPRSGRGQPECVARRQRATSGARDGRTTDLESGGVCASTLRLTVVFLRGDRGAESRRGQLRDRQMAIDGVSKRERGGWLKRSRESVPSDPRPMRRRDDRAPSLRSSVVSW